MRAKSIKNITGTSVKLIFPSGMSAYLPPVSTIENVDIVNVAEIKDRVVIVEDLTEVTRSSGKTQING